MPSDLKRIIIAAALAAAAFNATAPAKQAHDMQSPTPKVAETVDTAPILVAEHRPSRIRIGGCSASDVARWGKLTEI